LNCSPEQTLKPTLKCEQSLKIWLLRLAEQAKRNTKLIIEFELPPEKEGGPK
jgi:hypothetical protein